MPDAQRTKPSSPAVSFRPIAVVGRCWLHDEVRLTPATIARPLNAPLSFKSEVDFVLELAVNELRLKPHPDFHRVARDRLEGTEPTALIHLPRIRARTRRAALRQLLPRLEAACDALAFTTANAVVPIAALLVEDDNSFRVRFFPSQDTALIHLNGDRKRMPKIVSAAKRDGDLALALSLLRAGLQAQRPETRMFHFAQALDMLSASQRGGTIAVRMTALMKSVGLTPAKTSDPSKNFADVLAALRNVVAHGKRLDHSNVAAYVAPYLADQHLEVRVRDLLREVIARLADPSDRS